MAPAASTARSSALATTGIKRRALIAAAACGLAAVGLRFIAVKLQNALLYHPRPIHGDPYYEQIVAQTSKKLKAHGYKVQEVAYQWRNESQVALLVRPELQKPAPLWVVFGGNAMVSADWLPFCEAILSRKEVDLSPSFLLVDYPGYGDNKGKPSPSNVLEASELAVQQALSSLPAPESLNLFGHSLGAAAAAQLAVKLVRSRPPGRLLLSSPFLSIDAMAAVIFGNLVPSWLLRSLVTHRWDNAAAAPEAASAGWEVTIVHPKRDEIVPVRHGEALAKSIRALGKDCRFVTPDSCGHNDVISVAWQTYSKFLGLSRL